MIISVRFLTDKVIQLIYKAAYRLLCCIWYIFRPSTCGASVAVWCDNRILIIKNSYKKEFSMPGGSVKRREGEKEAAARELYEEVNIQLDPEQLCFAGRFTSRHEFKHDTVTFFQVEFSKLPIIRIDNREVIWAKFLSPSEAATINLCPLVQLYLKNRDLGFSNKNG